MRKYFENLKIGRKIILSFAIVLILYIGTVVIALLSINDLSDRMKKLYDEPFANVQASLAMSGELQTVGKNITLMALSENLVDISKYLSATQEIIKDVEAAYEVLSTGYQSGGESMERLKTEFARLKDPRDRVLSCLSDEKSEEALEIYTNEYLPLSDSVREILSEVSGAAIQDADESMTERMEMSRSVMTFLITVALICVFLTVVLWLIITRSIIRPINEVKEAANDIANGQLTTNLTYSSQNELGQLADDIRSTSNALSSYVKEIERSMQALGNGRLNYKTNMDFKGDFKALGEAIDGIGSLLKNSIQQISSSAEQVFGGAEQVSNGAQALAQGTSEQAGSIEELAVSINEIADSVKINADNSVSSSKVADTVGNQLANCNTQMQELMEYMKSVQNNSSEITGIVKEIEDIAFQTNILALNAAVEAARAGEAGRGFSVVATEVRRLASKTTEASKLTAELIEKNSRAVTKGMGAVQSTAETLKDSVAGAQNMTKMVDKISELSVQQADAITQIRKSVELISEIVQGNSATSEESAAASEELSAQAQILKELVDQFEV